MKNSNKIRGISILGVLVLGVALILVLSYFNISIKSVVESPKSPIGQENVSYVGGGAKSLWTTYLAEPASYLWKDVWINIFWKSFISNMERIRDGKSTDFDKAAENLKIQQ